MDSTNTPRDPGPGGESVTAELLPLSIGDVFDEAFDLYKRNFALFAGIVAVLSVPMQVLAQAVNMALGLDRIAATMGPGGDSADPSAAMSAAFGFMAIGFLQAVVFTFIHVIQSGALTVAVSERYLGRQVTLGNAYKRAWRRIGPLLLTWVLVLLAVGGIALVLVLGVATVGAAIVGLLSMAGTAGEVAGVGVAIVAAVVAGFAAAAAIVVLGLFTTQVVALEGVSYGRAIERNWALVRRRVPRLCLAVILLWTVQLCLWGAFYQSLEGVLSLAVYPVLRVPEVAQSLASSAVSAVLWMLLEPFWLVCVTLLYYDQRVRREGFDLTVLERNVQAMSMGKSGRR